MHIINKTVNTTGIHSADYVKAAARYNRFARSQNRRLVVGIAGLLIGLVLTAITIGLATGWIGVYHALNTGVFIPGLGGIELDGGSISFFTCGGEC
jgi:hypothetical protein